MFILYCLYDLYLLALLRGMRLVGLLRSAERRWDLERARHPPPQINQRRGTGVYILHTGSLSEPLFPCLLCTIL
jgi:hypothetical protein